jgi:hypothetical protein
MWNWLKTHVSLAKAQATLGIALMAVFWLGTLAAAALIAYGIWYCL